MPPLLELHRIAKNYAALRAVDDVSLSVEPGVIYALVGPSGCGKTTTLRLIGGLERPTSGKIVLRGQDITRNPPYRRNVSTVFQNYALFPHMNVQDNVQFGLKQKRAPGKERRSAELLELVQLGHKSKSFPHQLSGGERQRVALARSLAVEPDVLLLDEPLSALDPNLRKQVRAELKALQKRVGTAFLLVTHDQEEALSLSSRIAVMRAGRIEEEGTPESLYLRPRSAFTAEFFGPVNWFGKAGVRPQAMRIARTYPTGAERTLQATVTDVAFLGHCVHLKVQISTGQTIAIESPVPEIPYRPGDEVHTWWLPANEFQRDIVP